MCDKSKLEQDLKGARWQAQTVTTFEDEPTLLRRTADEQNISESVEVEKPAKQKATATEVSVGQSSADTVAAGVAFTEETNEDEAPCCDPDTGYTWVRSDLSKFGESVGQSTAPQRDSARKDKESKKTRRRKKSDSSPSSPSSSSSPDDSSDDRPGAARGSMAMVRLRRPPRAQVRDRDGGTGDYRASDDRPRSTHLACASGNRRPSRLPFPLGTTLHNNKTDLSDRPSVCAQDKYLCDVMRWRKEVEAHKVRRREFLNPVWGGRHVGSEACHRPCGNSLRRDQADDPAPPR